MHACTKAFWYLAQNPAVAKQYSIVMGSSHCEQLLRDNLDEWTNNFQSEYGAAPGDWNWATNSAKIKTYWKDRVIQSKNQDAVYTMGMRGIHDSGIPGYSTDEERRTALIDIINNQRNILSTNLEKPISDIPQVFIPYKEVLKIYKLGINLPEDVTLMWADDNFGYMRQLSNPAEQLRSGGGGIYYHFSYLGPPCSYLWLESVSPALTEFELQKAYDMNCKTMWIFNVGDIKPQEFSLQHAMDIAWNINTINLQNPDLYAKRWAEETFGQQFSEQIYQIKKEYFSLASAGKPENLNNMSFTVKQIEDRIHRYNALVELSQALEAQIPSYLQDAYFQLIKYPVECAAAMNVKNLGAKLSFEYGAQGRREEALAVGANAIRAFNQILALTRYYNTELAGGKWNGMMSYKPNNSEYYNDPNVISENAISNILSAPGTDSIVCIPAGAYTVQNAGSRTFLEIEGLGVTDRGITVYPYDMTAYTAENIATAPYLEYSLPVLLGANVIAVQCLPSFPLYNGLQLRYAISIDGGVIEFKNVETILEGESSAAWGENVMKGVSQNTSIYNSATDKTVTVRIYFPDPALVVSAIQVSTAKDSPLTKLIKNNSFEYARENELIGDASNAGWDGANWRAKRSTEGEFYGWNVTNWNFRSSSNYSQGVNKDMTNIEGNYACWIAGDLVFPDFWEFYQLIPADSLEAGTYKVSCRLAVEDVKRTSQRLFANNNVQYHGTESQYANNLTAGETASFAGYPSGTSNLQEMVVYTTIADSDSLKIGIRTGRKKGDGTAASNASPLWGWFKVDYFRLEKVSLDTVAPVIPDTADYTSYIVNPSFEYKSEGVLNDGATFRGTPYGWSDRKEGFTNNSFGINNDAVNLAGKNCCWYASSPMPADFELYQIVRGLPAGRYMLSARMAIMDEKFSTQRIFANNNVQYFGAPIHYGQNINESENYAFAGWYSTAARYLKDMQVEVEIADGDSLRIGVRSSNILANGESVAADNHGWFKVDDFRLTLIQRQGTEIKAPAQNSATLQFTGTKGGLYVYSDGQETANVSVYSLTGRRLVTQTLKGNTTFIPLPQGYYLVSISDKSSVPIKAKVATY
ncbi:MAG: glycosyl hydrolase 115 family protein, partial [Dysgonamonadaceae bacterium]|jgi:hypothetical protein|nr:glycosyl hydrolase 115 family protein [Dysgonamonadaceae bacterium]